MAFLVPDNCKLVLEPGPGWQWFAFDGVIGLSTSKKRADHEGAMLCIDSDITAAAHQVIGCSYKASGFEDIPGTVVICKLQVDNASLCKRTHIEGRPTVLSTTQGTFQIVVAPALKAGAPPIPDPIVQRSGSWRIRCDVEPRTDAN